MAYNNPMMRVGQPPLDPMTGLPVEDVTMVPPRYSPVAGGFTEKTQQEVQNMAEMSAVAVNEMVALIICANGEVAACLDGGVSHHKDARLVECFGNIQTNG